MAPLVATATMNHAVAHLLGPNHESFSRHHLSSSLQQNSKRRCNLSFRPRAAESQNGSQTLSPSEVPKRDWFPSDFIFGAATSAYQVWFFECLRRRLLVFERDDDVGQNLLCMYVSV
jgi:beta-glucosidase